MKKVLAVMVVLMFALTVSCLAQEGAVKSTPVTAAKTTPVTAVKTEAATAVKAVEKTVEPVVEAVKTAPVQEMVVNGTVSAVVLPDAAKGITSGKITVVDAKGAAVDVVVDSSAKIIGASMLPTSLDKVKKDDKVQVKCVKEADGSHKAVGINIVK